MAKEIERKFLVHKEMTNSAYLSGHGVFSNEIRQGYLFDIRKHVARIRTCSDNTAKFTYKGPTKGISRTEIEFSIPHCVGELLLKCIKRVIHKTRLTAPTLENHHGIADDMNWEIDTFHNLDIELTIAEIELPDEHTSFAIPDWLGIEVSHDPCYYNSNLINKVVK